MRSTPICNDLELFKAKLRYEPETGKFYWIHGCTRRKLGAEAGALRNGYVLIMFLGRPYRAHRIAYFFMKGVWPTHKIDHKNTIRNDNRWENLREATNSQNSQNTGKYKTNSTGFKGVHFLKRSKRFYSQLTVDGKKIFLGSFPTPEAAHAKYVEEATKHFGEFARFA